MDKTELNITKSNALINASFRLSLTETQILLYAISRINPLDNQTSKSYEINVLDFAREFRKDENGIYTDIKEAIGKRMFERAFSYETEKGLVVSRWLQSVRYSKKRGSVKITFSDEIMPFLHKLKVHFTTYNLEAVANFNNPYIIRIFELLISRLNSSKHNKIKVNFEIEALKQILDIKNQYASFYDLKRRILEPAKKQINQFTDLEIDYAVERRGRTPHALIFTVERLTQLESTKNSAQNIKPRTIEIAKKLLYNAGLRVEIYVIEADFHKWRATKKEKALNIDAAFIGYCKRIIKENKK